jgi:Spy/CpxP family protein refolding chaperone
MRTMVTTLLVGLSLLAAAPQASAFGRHGGPGFFPGPGGPGGPGGGPGGELRLLVRQMTPEQRKQVRDVLMADRDARRDILTQLRAAHEALGDKTLAAGTVGDADVAPLVDKIAGLHKQLLQQGTKAMLQVRAIATPEQLAQAASTKQRLDQLRDEMDKLIGRPSDGDDDAPPMD